MRIYEGAPRQNYEEVLRSIGALLDQRGMREITLNETEDGRPVETELRRQILTLWQTALIRLSRLKIQDEIEVGLRYYPAALSAHRREGMAVRRLRLRDT